MNIHAVDQGGESRPEYRARIRAQRAQAALSRDVLAPEAPEADDEAQLAEVDTRAWLRRRWSQLPRWQAHLVEDRNRRQLY